MVLAELLGLFSTLALLFTDLLDQACLFFQLQTLPLLFLDT
jgi:hypothetical protein